MNTTQFIAHCKKEFPNYTRGMIFPAVKNTIQCQYITKFSGDLVILASLENGKVVNW